MFVVSFQRANYGYASFVDFSNYLKEIKCFIKIKIFQWKFQENDLRPRN